MLVRPSVLPLPASAAQRPHPWRRPRTLSALAVLAVVLGAISVRPSNATAGDAPAPAGGPPADAAALEAAAKRLADGAKYFDQAILWVARGGALGKTQDLYVHLDAKWDLDDNHHEGEQTVWFASPDKLRNELTAMQRTTTKILNGDKAWVVAADGTPHRLHGTPGAEKDVGQLREDLMRVQDMSSFVTLEGLKGPGIVFEHLGESQGSGVYAGNWIKVARRSPDGRKITFWLAYETGPDGTIRATWPGIARVDGDVASGYWTEDWILKEWDSPRAKPRPFRYPAKIQAWRTNPDPAAAKTDPPRRFLSAIVDDIQVNLGIPPSRFEPPK